MIFRISMRFIMLACCRYKPKRSNIKTPKIAVIMATMVKRGPVGNGRMQRYVDGSAE